MSQNDTKESDTTDQAKNLLERHKFWFDIAWKVVFAIAAIFVYFRFDATSRTLENLIGIAQYENYVAPNVTLETEIVGIEMFDDVRVVDIIATVRNGGNVPVTVENVDLRIQAATIKPEILKAMRTVNQVNCKTVRMDESNTDEMNWETLPGSEVSKTFSNKLAPSEQLRAHIRLAFVPRFIEEQTWLFIDCESTIDGDQNLRYRQNLPVNVASLSPGSAKGCGQPYQP